MRAIPADHSASFEVTVSEAMTVDFEQSDPRLGRLHPVYATYWLTRHAELVSRKLVLPFLEEDEEGIGFEVAVRHLASALPGMRLHLVSRFVRAEGNRIYARWQADSELDDRIGEGSTTQVVLPKARLQASFENLRERWNRS